MHHDQKCGHDAICSAIGLRCEAAMAQFGSCLGQLAACDRARLQGPASYADRSRRTSRPSPRQVLQIGSTILHACHCIRQKEAGPVSGTLPSPGDTRVQAIDGRNSAPLRPWAIRPRASGQPMGGELLRPAARSEADLFFRHAHSPRWHRLLHRDPAASPEKASKKSLFHGRHRVLA